MGIEGAVVFEIVRIHLLDRIVIRDEGKSITQMRPRRRVDLVRRNCVARMLGVPGLEISDIHCGARSTVAGRGIDCGTAALAAVGAELLRGATETEL